ncbi:BCCT family transporter [Pseudalkalibacillus caeni]|uniref:BCCT family transporter n=1 Tax=Exobacillus caeni TaxID=2574798 RepID=A0A5R9FDH1_9BACL|nr:BCCT family transporter [Pseudalkalibacillus caeni]TLS38923.1 BCCT family transporter [Pseudalkalibacillus caeni]
MKTLTERSGIISSSDKKLGLVFYATVSLALLLVLWGLVFPDNLSLTMKTTLNWINHTFGWFYMLVDTLLVGFALFLAFGPYRHIKLGEPDSKPAYSYFSWLGMLFAAGMGVGLVFYGVAEPILHYVNPAPGIKARTQEAAESALTYSVFHWGLQPWAVYTIIGLTLAYFGFRKKSPSLLSSAFEPLLGEKVKGPIGKGINIVATLATIIGVSTTFGLSSMQVSGGLNEVFGLPNTPVTQLVVIAVVTVLFMISALSGVNKGIRYLSMTNLGIAGFMLLFVLITGPTVFLLKNFITATGQYLGDYLQLSLSFSPYDNEDWRGKWTMFFWAWGLAWGPFVGAFIARVSKGRTIQQFVLGVLLVPSLLGAIWFVVFGGTALHMQIYDHIEIAAQAKKHVETALFATLEQLPFGTILSFLGLLLISIFFVTSADSATYILSVFSSKGTLHPKKLVKIIWGSLISGIAAILLLSGGLEALQSAAIASALPFAVVIIAMSVSITIALKNDLKDQKSKEG